MLIYSKYHSPRLEYVLKFIFRDVFRASYKLTQNPEDLESHNGCRIAYTDEKPEGAFYIPDAGLLSETGIRKRDPGVHALGDMKVLFAMPGSTEIEFDVFSAVFYMITRYEEYLPFSGDRHGRFEAGSSLAFRHGFLELPVVDLWLKDLRKKILDWFPGQKLAEGTFNFTPTTDVDLPFSILHRGCLRTRAGNLRALLRSRTELVHRRTVLKGETDDPFYTFNDIDWLHSQHHMRPTLFFLCAGYGRYDKSISPGAQVFRELVKKTAEFASIGIHPSYRSNRKPVILTKEIDQLKEITGEQPLKSRQHYLKLRLPDTYRSLIKSGIREDYSMGFASAAGFRAGTARPFFFYDLQDEQETELKIIPFQLMDRSLKDYMGLTPGEAYGKMRDFVDIVSDSGGTLVSIWHNDAFSDVGEWKGWRETYIRMLDYVAGKC